MAPISMDRFRDLGTVWAAVGLDYSGFNRGRAEVSRQVQQLDDEMNRRTQAMEQHWQRLGRNMSLAITTPLTVIGTQMTWTFANFEQSMAMAGAVAQATTSELRSMTEVARELGATTQYSASQAAEGMTFLAMAGFQAQEAIAALPGVLELAASAQLDLATAADIATNILTGYGLAVEELGRVNDVLVSAMTGANTNLQQLGEAMKYAGPVASGAGISFEEAAAALSMMGNAGIQASMAGTALRGAITYLLNPTKQVRDVIERLGLDLYDTSGNLRSLVEIVAELERTGATTGDMMALFGQRAGPAMQALVSQGSAALAEFNERLLESSGTASRIAGQQMDTLRGDIITLRSAYDELAISLTETAAPAMRTVLQVAAELLRWFADLPQPVRTATVAVAGATASIGPLILAINGLNAALRALAGPAGMISLAVSALGGLGFAFLTAQQRGEDFYRSLTREVASFVDQAKDLDNQVNTVSSLMREYEELTAKTEASADEHSRLLEVIDALVETVPYAAAEFDEYGRVIGINAEAINEYTENLIRLRTVQMQLAEVRLAGLEDEIRYRLPELEAQLAKQHELYNFILSVRKELRQVFEEAGMGDRYGEWQNYSRELDVLFEKGTRLRDLADELIARYAESGDPVWINTRDIAIFASEVERLIGHLEPEIVDLAEKIIASREALQELDLARRELEILEGLREPPTPEPPPITTPVVFEPVITEDDIRVEAELWQHRIALARLGVRDIIETYGSLEEIQQRLRDLLEEVVADPEWSESFRAEFAGLLETLRREMDEAGIITEADVRREQTLWQARILLAEMGVRDIIETFGAIDDVKAQYQDFLRSIVDDPSWSEDLRAQMARSLDSTVLITELEEIRAVFEKYGPIYEDFWKRAFAPDIRMDAIATHWDELRGRLDTYERTVGEILFREFLVGNIPFWGKDGQRFEEVVENYFRLMVESGAIALQLQRDMLEHQIAALGVDQIGSDKWLELSRELRQIQTQITIETREARIAQLELLAELAEQEGNILDSRLLREQVAHERRLIQLQDYNEAYELELERHNRALAQIEEEYYAELEAVIREKNEELAELKARGLEKELLQLQHAKDAELRAVGDNEAAKLAIEERYAILRAQVHEDHNREMARLEGEVQAAELESEGKTWEARLLRLDTQFAYEVSNREITEAEKQLISERYAAERSALLRSQQWEEEDIARDLQDKLDQIGLEGLERSRRILEQEYRNALIYAERQGRDTTGIHELYARLIEQNEKEHAENLKRILDESAIAYLEATGRTLDAAMARIDMQEEARRREALAEGATQEDLAQIQAHFDAVRLQAKQQFVDSWLQTELQRVRQEARLQEWSNEQLQEAIEEQLELANGLVEGIRVSASLAAQVEIDAMNLRKQVHDEYIRGLEQDVRHRAQLERWSAGRLADALENEVLAYAEAHDIQKRLMQDIELLRVEQMERERERAKAHTDFLVNQGLLAAQAEMEAALAALEQAFERGDPAVDWRDVEEARIELARRRVADFQAAEEHVMAMVEMSTQEQIDSIHRIIEAWEAFYGERAEQSEEIQRLLEREAELIRQLNVEIVESQIESVLATDSFVDSLEREREALLALQNEWANVENATRAQQLIAETLIQNEQRIARAQEDAARRQAEWEEFLVRTGQQAAEERLQAEVDAIKARLDAVKAGTDEHLQLQRDLAMAEHALQEQMFRNWLANYERQLALGELSAEQQLGLVREQMQRQRELFGERALLSMDYVRLIVLERELEESINLERAQGAIAFIRAHDQSIRGLHEQIQLLEDLKSGYMLLGTEATQAIEAIDEAIRETEQQIDRTLSETALVYFTGRLRQVLIGQQTIAEAILDTITMRSRQAAEEVISEAEQRMARFVEDMITGAKSFEAAWSEAWAGFAMSAEAAAILVVLEVFRMLSATQDARRRLKEQAKRDREEMLSDQQRFAELVAAGFAGQFETTTRTYTERVSYLFGLFHRVVKHSQEITSADTEAWIARMSALLEELQGVGRSALTDAFAIAPGHEWIPFLEGLRNGIYDSVHSGLIDAFTDSAAYTRVMAPLFQAMDAAIEESFATGIFDPVAFWQTFGPALERFEREVGELEGPVAVMREVLAQVQEMLGLPISHTWESGGTRLTNLTGEQRDHFTELMRPIRVLDMAPGWHDEKIRRMDTIIELLAEGIGERAVDFVRSEHVLIEAGQIIVEQITTATFTGPVYGPMTIHVGEDELVNAVRRVLRDDELSGETSLRAIGD